MDSLYVFMKFHLEIDQLFLIYTTYARLKMSTWCAEIMTLLSMLQIMLRYTVVSDGTTSTVTHRKTLLKQDRKSEGTTVAERAM